jgi:hypothetical protein
MIKTMQARSQIADFFQENKIGTIHDGAFAAYYTSNYLIQDTSESIYKHRLKGFSKDPHSAYIELWGILQAVNILQDSIIELSKFAGLSVRKPKIDSASHRLRELRIELAGHPANRERGPKTRSFISRHFGSYSAIQYERYNQIEARIEHPVFHLGELLDQFDEEASILLGVILGKMSSS